MTALQFVLLADHPDVIATVANWYFKEWGHVEPGNSVEKTMERIRGKLNRTKAPLHLLAIEAGAVVGVAQLKIREMDIFPEREFWLGGVFVSPDARRRGIASALVERIGTMAAAMGITTLHLQTERLDGGLYARLGWTILETVTYHGLRVAVMERRIGDVRT